MKIKREETHRSFWSEAMHCPEVTGINTHTHTHQQDTQKRRAEKQKLHYLFSFIRTKNENVISPNVNYHRSKSHAMNYAQSVGGRIYAMERTDVARPADDPLLSSCWRRSIGCCIECYSCEESPISNDLDQKHFMSEFSFERKRDLTGFGDEGKGSCCRGSRHRCWLISEILLSFQCGQPGVEGNF